MAKLAGVTIGTISGGIVNFGGAVFISPISVTKTISGAGGNNTGAEVVTKTGTDLVQTETVTDILKSVKSMLG